MNLKILYNKDYKLLTFRRVMVQQLILEQIFQNLISASMPTQKWETIKKPKSKLQKMMKNRVI